MAPSAPKISLFHGQVLWCLAGGGEPSPLLRDQVRYLRHLGIPFDEDERGKGRGVRVTYDFYHFIEVGVAFELLRQRIEPRLLQKLIDERPLYKNVYREAYLELAAHPTLFEGDPRQRSILDNELLIRLGDRYSKTPGKVSFAADSSSAAARRFGDLVEADVGGREHAVIPLKSLTLSLLKLAKVAPVTKPGPKS